MQVAVKRPTRPIANQDPKTASRSRILDWRWWLGMKSEVVLREPPVMGVVAFNEEKHIAATIQSLLNQTYPLQEIIVVDDCSTDDTSKIAQQFVSTGRVRVIRTLSNSGTKARAQNYALYGIDSELFLTVDADTILRPDALYEAMRVFNDPNAQVVCGSIVPQKITNFWEFGRFGEYLFAQALMKPAQEHTGLVLVASGCFSVFRTATARRHGFFNIRTKAEDMDLTWDIQNEGGRVYYASRATCYPVEPSTMKMYVNQLSRWHRGFFQNLKVRNYRVFGQKKSMALMTYGLLMWYGISALLMPLFFYKLSGNVLDAALYTLLINALTVWVPSMIMAVKLGVWRKAPLAILAYTFIPYINLVVYIKSFVEEVVLNRELAVWHKGH
jgi:biofilm PGA synthesis N-glycosyltransferase PgaC